MEHVLLERYDVVAPGGLGLVERAVGGAVQIESAPGAGCVVSGVIPVS